MKRTVLLLLVSLSSLIVGAQQIVYSTPEKDDLLISFRYNFDIIGKVNNNLFIYKNIRYKHLISLYDEQMKLKENVNLDFLPNNLNSVEFVNYPDRVFVIYQYQKKKVFYCMASVLDSNGKVITAPFQLDSTHIKFIADIRLYHVAISEDKSKIMVYKLYKGDVFTGNGLYTFSTSLFNDSLRLIHKSEIQSNFETDNDLFSDFLVDNDGNFVFVKGSKLEPTELYNEGYLVTKSAIQDDFKIYSLHLSGNLLEHIDLRIDNVNQQYVINSLFYKKENGHKEGLYTAMFNNSIRPTMTENYLLFSDTTTALSKLKSGAKQFDNDYLKDVIFTKDGGFVLTIEDLGIQGAYVSAANMYNTHPIFFSSSYVFSTFKYLASPFWKNVIVLQFDKNAKLNWVVDLEKFQHYTVFSSYAFINTGEKIHFFYNEEERQRQVMNAQTLSRDGKVSEKAPLHNLDFDYQMVPIRGKQVSAHEMIFPCAYAHFICFAKVNF